MPEQLSRQLRRVIVQDLRNGHTTVEYDDGATAGDVAMQACSQLGVRVGVLDHPTLAVEGTALHGTDSMDGRIDPVYDLVVIGGVV
jgi:hypothetical protein